MVNAIFKETDDGPVRMVGHANVEYSSDDDGEIVKETTVEELSDRFRNAPHDTLPDLNQPIEEAVKHPLSYPDYLILDENDEIVFDEEHSRYQEK